MKRFILIFPITLILAGCASQSTTVDAPEISPFSFEDHEDLLSTVEQLGMQSLEEEELHLHTGVDDEFLYIVADIRNRNIQRKVEDYGLRIAIESEANWLSLTYPIGLVEALRDFPDAAVSYIMDPSWVDDPQNESTLEQARHDRENRALLAQEPDESPIQITLTELHAQNLRTTVRDNQGFYTIAYRIPLEGGRNQQFSPEARHDEQLSVNVSVNPPSAEELTGEELSSGASGSNVGGNMMGGNMGQRGQGRQGQQQEEETTMADRVDRMLGSGYSTEFHIQLGVQGQN